MVLKGKGPHSDSSRPGLDGERAGYNSGACSLEEPRCLVEDDDDEKSPAAGQQPDGGDHPRLPPPPSSRDGVVEYGEHHAGTDTSEAEERGGGGLLSSGYDFYNKAETGEEGQALQMVREKR